MRASSFEGKCLKIALALRRIGLGAALWCGATVALAACPPAGMTKPFLEALKTVRWSIADDARRQALAVEMLDCLASPDPELRDELGFDALSHWMRAGQLDTATLQAIRASLLVRLRTEPPETSEFRVPFAALALAEVARVDRLTPFLSTEERAGLVAAATDFLPAIRDYRGFEPGAGWRHGVAHGADLMLQLALNPALNDSQIESILAAIATQVMPPVEHSYVYGEGERLMAPVFYIGRRDQRSKSDWDLWFGTLARSRPKADPPTRLSLAAKHNLAQFLYRLHASLKEIGTPEMQARMLPGVTAALKTLD